MIQNQTFTINVLHLTGGDQLINSAEIERLNPLIKQKINLIVQDIYSSMSEKDKKSIDKIVFSLIDSDQIKFKIIKTEGEIDYDSSQLKEDNQLRMLECVRLINEFGVGILAPSELPDLTEPQSILQGPLFQAQVAPRSTQGPIIVRLFRSIQRWYIDSFTLNPQLQIFTQSYFDQILDLKALKKKWQSSEKTMEKFADKLYQQVNQGQRVALFSKEEILQRIQKDLEAEFQVHYASLAGHEISLQDMRLLRNEKKITEVAARFENLVLEQEKHLEKDLYQPKHELEKDLKNDQEILEDFLKVKKELEETIESGSETTAQNEKNREALAEVEAEIKITQADIEKSQKALAEHQTFIDQQHQHLHDAQELWQKTIDSMPVLDIPLEKLAYVPVNVYTEEDLIHTWERILNALVEEGDLQSIGQESDDPALLIKHSRYGDAYLHALQTLPKELKEILKPLLPTVDAEKIEKFIWSQPNTLDLKSLPSFDQQQKRQLTYQRFIKPLMDETLDGLYKENKDFVNIADDLKDLRSFFIEDWADQAVKRLKINGIGETERQTMDLTKQHLVNQLIDGLEKLGVDSYHISGEQLKRLKQARETLEEHRAYATQAETVLTGFKERLATFEKEYASLNAQIAAENKRAIPLELEIPDLKVPLEQLDQEGFQNYIQEQEEELSRLQSEMAQYRKTNGKKAIVPHQWQTEANRLKQTSIPMLKTALADWDNRNKIIQPSTIQATIKGSKRDLNSLTTQEKERITSNLETVKQNIKKLTESPQAATDQKIKKALQKENELRERFEQILENPQKAQERDQKIQEFEADKQVLQEKLSESAFEQFADFPVLHMPVLSLLELPVTEANQPIMSIVWESILTDLKDTQLTEKSSESHELHYLEVVEGLKKLTAPSAFKQEMNAYVDNLEKPAMATQYLLQKFIDLKEMRDGFDHQIQEATDLIPSAEATIPAFDIPWTQAEPSRLQDLLKSKRQEVKLLEQEKQKQETTLSETRSNIANYEKIKDPKIKRKGGLQILNQKVTDLETKLEKKQQRLDKMQTNIAKIEAIIAGEEVEIEETDIIVVKSYQGHLDELSVQEWEHLENIQNEIREQVEALPEDQKNPSLEARLQSLETLFQLRDQIAEQQSVVQQIEQEKIKGIEEQKIKIKAAIQQIDSAEVRVHELLTLDIDSENEELAVKMWQTLLQNSVINGQLEDLDHVAPEQKSQSESYATQYLTMKQVLADSTHPALQTVIKEFNQASSAPVKVTDKETPTDVQQEDLENRLHSFLEKQVEAKMARKELLEPTGSELLFGKIEIPRAPLEVKVLTESQKKEEENFNSYERENLKLLTKALEKVKAKQSLAQQEKENLHAFVSYAKQNNSMSKALNAKLSLIMDRKTEDMKETIKSVVFGIYKEDTRPFKKIPYGISEEAVEMIMTLSYNFRTPQTFAPLVDRFETLMGKIESGADIRPEDQLTPREIGLMQKCAKLARDEDEDNKSLLTRLEEIGVIEQDPALHDLQKLSQRAQILIKKAQEIFVKEVDYQDGDLVTNLGRQKLEFAGRHPNPEEEIHFRLITPYCHGAKLYKDNGKTMQSHVMGNYIQDEFTLAEEFYSEVWRLDVAALIPKKMQPLLEEKLGKNWQQILQQRYQGIENNIQKNKNKQFTLLKNPWQSRINAGKADYMWGGHATKTEQDFEKLADDILSEKEENPEQMTVMICSEFVTKTTLAALVKLNRELSQELGDHLIQKGQEAEGEKLKTKRNALELPYSKTESLERVHPGRMIDLLTQRNCVKRLEKPKIIGQLLRSDKAAR